MKRKSADSRKKSGKSGTPAGSSNKFRIGTRPELSLGLKARLGGGDTPGSKPAVKPGTKPGPKPMSKPGGTPLSKKLSAARKYEGTEGETEPVAPRRGHRKGPKPSRPQRPVDQSWEKVAAGTKRKKQSKFAPREDAATSFRSHKPSHVPGPAAEKFKSKGRGPSARPQKVSPRRASDVANQVEGVVKRHPDGFGFLIPDNRELPDIYVPRHEMSGVMTNDRILVEYHPAREEDRLFGNLIRIVSRGTKRVVGAYLPVDEKYGVLQDTARAWGMDLRISAEDAMGAKDGDLVAVEITRYPGPGGQAFTGRVLSLIGSLEEPLNDVKRIIFGHHIPEEFTSAALAEARQYGAEVTEKDMQGRQDLRDLKLVTIDGATARDFDDAIYTESTHEGFRLWVAIADVSHYVKPGMRLDQEAYEKGTSTYFPNYVVPMLPEELSNELCSLKPHVPRLSFVCEMRISFDGEIMEHKFYEAVIRSHARVTYGEAQEVVDGATPEKLRPVEENIKRCADLARVLMARRFREGSLDLEIPETQVVVDPSGESVDIIRAERIFAHRLIEELMLAANISTARFLSDANIPALYRIHEPPAEESIQALQNFLYNFGGTRKMGGGKLQKQITEALRAFEGRPEAQILNILTLRTMNQAKYSPENVGHFGLGFSHYTHFTSPIRRYPDLIVHRLIKSQIYPAYRRLEMNEEELATAGTMLSACEQRSAKAERQLISIKKSRFMGRFLGEEFDGIISSVTKFGVFVLLRTYDVDGLVKIEELGDDKFIFDDENLRLVGKRTGLSYHIGDPIRVQVAAVDPEAGRIDFVLAEEQPEREAGEGDGGSDRNARKNRKDAQKRGKVQNNSERLRKKRISKRSRADKARSVRT